jgi:hypothetical protein
VAAIVKEAFESMNPASPTTVPESTRVSPPLSDTPVIRSNPAATSVRPKVAIVLAPTLVASRPATGAATTEAEVMGRKMKGNDA